MTALADKGNWGRWQNSAFFIHSIDGQIIDCLKPKKKTGKQLLMHIVWKFLCDALFERNRPFAGYMLGAENDLRLDELYTHMFSQYSKLRIAGYLKLQS
jgi:hypothetical protein